MLPPRPDAAADSVDALVQRYSSGLYNARYALASYGPHLDGRMNRWRSGLDSASVDVRASAARALGLLGDPNPATVSQLRKRLHDSEAVATASAQALGDLGVAASSAIPELSALVHTPSTSLREAAAVALIRISLEAAEKAASAVRPVIPRLLSGSRSG